MLAITSYFFVAHIIYSLFVNMMILHFMTPSSDIDKFKLIGSTFLLFSGNLLTTTGVALLLLNQRADLVTQQVNI